MKTSSLGAKIVYNNFGCRNTIILLSARGGLSKNLALRMV